MAVQLAQALNIGLAQDEAEAENLLSAKGIEPKNGWIADYPVTPDIVAEIEKSVGAAAEAQNLGMGKDEALKTVEEVVGQLGLNVQPGMPQAPIGETQPYSPPPEVVNDYYYDYGPPVVTYYAPPYPYDYLYAWVPFPFWYSGFFFGGFFVLHDFHRHVFFHNHPCVVTNHFVNPINHRMSVVDPASRHLGWGAVANRGPSRQVYNSPRAQSSARAIVTQNWNRTPGFNSSAASRVGNRTAPPAATRPPAANPGRSGSSEERGFSGFRAPSGPRMTQPRSESAAPSRSEGRVYSLPSRSPGAFMWSSPKAYSSPSASFGHAPRAPVVGSHGSFSGFHASSSLGFSHGAGSSFGGFHGGGHR